MVTIISIAFLAACGSEQPPAAPVAQAGLGASAMQVAPMGGLDPLLSGIEFGDVHPFEVRVVWESDMVMGAIAEAAEPEPIALPEPERFQDDGAQGQKAISRSAPATTAQPVQAALIEPEPIAVEPETIQVAASPEVMSVDKVIRRYATQTQYCHETAKERYSQVAGRIELTWVISDGQVSEVQVLDNTTGDEAMAACVARKVQRWRFPSETSEEVRHPFVFQKAL